FRPPVEALAFEGCLKACFTSDEVSDVFFFFSAASVEDATTGVGLVESCFGYAGSVATIPETSIASPIVSCKISRF
ncbi:MAG: hypothetical protein QG568_615, partial [Patescibacteria group bacterium]|nr:hypothetical protein [Patescibacteria group bacterium]